MDHSKIEQSLGRWYHLERLCEISALPHWFNPIPQLNEASYHFFFFPKKLPIFPNAA